MNALRDALEHFGDWWTTNRPALLTPSSERGPLRGTALDKIALDAMQSLCTTRGTPAKCDDRFDSADWYACIVPAAEWETHNGDIEPMWLLPADERSCLAESGSCLMAYVHTHCVERDVIRAHRLEHMSKTGDECEGYDALLVDDDFIVVLLSGVDYSKRVQHDERSPCSMCGTRARWRISGDRPFNKSRDPYVASKLVYDPKKLALHIDGKEVAKLYGRSVAALNGKATEVALRGGLDDGSGSDECTDGQFVRMRSAQAKQD